MAIMCSMDKKCKETSGMCIHEKMMMLFVMVGAVGAAGHFMFHWF